MQRRFTGRQLSHPLVLTLLASFCCILWGSAIPFINLGYRQFGIAGNDTASQMLFAGIRFFLAGLITIVLYSVLRRRILLPAGRSGWNCAVRLSLVQTVGQYVFFYIGVANTVSVKASILQGLGPFMSILVACYLFRAEKMDRRKWLGGILGAIGVVLVNLNGTALDLSVSLTGEGFLLLSLFASSCSAALIRIYGQQQDPVTLSGWQFMLGGAVMAVAGLVSGGSLHPLEGTAFLILGYLALLSAIAYSLWSLLLRSNPVSRVTVFIFLQPLFGVVLAYLLFGTQSTVPVVNCVFSLLLVCAGILIIEKNGSSRNLKQ